MANLKSPCRTFAVATLAGMICTLFGQSADTTPPVGDPNVVAMFFAYYDTLATDIQAKRGQSPATADIAEQSAAQSIGGLTVADFRRVGTIYNAVKQQVDAIDAEGTAYVLNLIATKQPPDVVKLRDLQSRRQGAIGGGIQALRHNLSPAGWSALSSYIDGEFRRGITRRLLK